MSAAAAGEAAAGTRLRVGVLLNVKKATKFADANFLESDAELDFVRIDAGRSLRDYAPLHALLLKMTDDLSAAVADRNVEKLSAVARVLDDLAAMPHTLVLEPPHRVQPLLFRHHTAAEIATARLRNPRDGSPVTTPPYIVLHAATGPAAAAEVASLQFPLVCKRLISCGVPRSHEMAIVRSAEAFASGAVARAMQLGDRDAVLAQQFVAHSGVIHKVYVLGAHVFVQQRPSIRLPERGDEAGVVCFASQHVPTEFDAAAWRAFNERVGLGAAPVWRDAAQVAHEGGVTSESMGSLAAQLRAQLGLDLFGFDVVVEEHTARLFLVDINYFPSYKGVPDFPALFKAWIKGAHRDFVARGLRSDPFVYVFGYGSLMSEASARQTMPCLRRFGVARVRGLRRIFNLVSISLLRSGQTAVGDKELAAVAAEPAGDDERSELLGSVFEIPARDLEAYREREHRYRFAQVEAQVLDASRRVVATVTAEICLRSSDAEYREKCGSREEYHRRVGQFYAGALWRDDVLPASGYLRLCLDAAAALGADILDNFLDSSLLADGVTTIREYLRRRPDLWAWPPARSP